MHEINSAITVCSLLPSVWKRAERIKLFILSGCHLVLSPNYESLVELLHGALQLAALVLPLLVVAHRLHGGALPCGGPRDVVHEVDPPHLVNATLPTRG